MLTEKNLNEDLGNSEFKIYYGSGFRGMNRVIPKMLSEGRETLSVSDLMRERLSALVSEGIKGPLWKYSFQTFDGSIRSKDKVKLVLDAQTIKEVNPESRYWQCGGGLSASEEAYNQAEGIEFSTKDLRKHIGQGWLTKDQAKSNPVWQYLAQDQDLLNDYVDAVQILNKQLITNTENRIGLGVNIPGIEFDYDITTVYPFSIGAITINNFLNNGSALHGRDMTSEFAMMIGKESKVESLVKSA